MPFAVDHDDVSRGGTVHSERNQHCHGLGASSDWNTRCQPRLLWQLPPQLSPCFSQLQLFGRPRRSLLLAAILLVSAHVAIFRAVTQVIPVNLKKKKHWSKKPSFLLRQTQQQDRRASTHIKGSLFSGYRDELMRCFYVGNISCSIVSWIASASLTALRKKDGSHRPVANFWSRAPAESV